MKYPPSFFKSHLPYSKNKTGPLYVQYFCRPISYITASIFAQFSIQANAASLIAGVIGLIACSLFYVSDLTLNIIGALLLIVWMILDCTDGNLARAIKPQKYGDFVDASSGYFILAFVPISLGFSVYHTGGALIGENNIWMIMLGAFAAITDSLARLIYQKFRNASEKKVIEEDIKKMSKKEKIFKFMTKNFSVSGMLPFVLVGTILGALDIIIIFQFLFNSFVLTASYLWLLVKVHKENKEMAF
ncbi:MAG: hypothetical protein FWG91_11985 [Lachnospiraceae bacterium]|nr:hypothetical protein [Lachnospiraceae bacterium]